MGNRRLTTPRSTRKLLRSDGASFANVVLKTLVSVPATGNLTFQCHTGDAKSFVDDIKLIGVEVGSIN